MRLTKALRSAYAAYLGGWRGTAVARAPLRYAICSDSGEQMKNAFTAAKGASRVEFWDGAVRRSVRDVK